MANIPKIRFKGFTGEWKQRKLGELVANLSTGKSVNSDDGSIHDGEIGILKTSCVSYDKFDPTENKRVIQNEVELVKCPVKKDCIIVSRMNTPERVGACGYIAENHDNLFLPDRLWQLKFQNNTSSYFIYTMLISPDYKNQIRSMASGTSGSMYNIPKERFLDLQVRISPNMDEQIAIGQYFEHLDNHITLYQRKLDSLQKFKKAMLQKMFPKAGSSQPEIRFKGFTGAWEQRKVGDCFLERNERSSCGELISVTINSGIKKFSDLNRKDNSSENKSNYKKVEIGDIAYNSMRMWQGASGYSPYSGILSPAYTVLIPEKGINSKFFSYMFKCIRLINTFQVMSQGLTSDTWNLKYPELSKINVLVPALNEQQKIGAYFENLDTLITLYQRKLDSLQKFKKAMLQKMFA